MLDRYSVVVSGVFRFVGGEDRGWHRPARGGCFSFWGIGYYFLPFTHQIVDAVAFISPDGTNLSSFCISNLQFQHKFIDQNLQSRKLLITPKLFFSPVLDFILHCAEQCTDCYTWSLLVISSSRSIFCFVPVEIPYCGAFVGTGFFFFPGLLQLRRAMGHHRSTTPTRGLFRRPAQYFFVSPACLPLIEHQNNIPTNKIFQVPEVSGVALGPLFHCVWSLPLLSAHPRSIPPHIYKLFREFSQQKNINGVNGWLSAFFLSCFLSRHISHSLVHDPPTLNSFSAAPSCLSPSSPPPPAPSSESRTPHRLAASASLESDIHYCLRMFIFSDISWNLWWKYFLNVTTDVVLPNTKFGVKYKNVGFDSWFSTVWHKVLRVISS